jgi:hypothetical protein
MCAWRVDQMVFKYISLLSLLFFFLQISNVSFGCSFNCGGTYTKGNEFGLKTTSKSGFKKHVFLKMPKNEHNFKYIKNKDEARAGEAYQRFELRQGDCFLRKGSSMNDCKRDRERFEFSSRQRQQAKGKQCYSYSLKLANDFKTIHPTNTALGQIHQRGGPKGKTGGFKSVPPIIQIGAKHNQLFLNFIKLTGDKNNVHEESLQYKLANISDMKDVWTDISFCLDYKNSKIEAWINGKKKVDALESPINFMPKDTYFKYGIYRSFISRYKNIHGKIPTQIVFYDEVRRGTSIEQVDRNINPKLKPVD